LKIQIKLKILVECNSGDLYGTFLALICGGRVRRAAVVCGGGKLGGGVRLFSVTSNGT
jgi:hypothetical protein